jgi:hypothetical protein
VHGTVIDGSGLEIEDVANPGSIEHLTRHGDTTSQCTLKDSGKLPITLLVRTRLL